MNIESFRILRRMSPRVDEDQLVGQQAKAFPERISRYLKKHFEKSFVSDIKKTRSKGGQIYYHVCLSYENTLFRLKFNEDGAMVLKQVEPLVELDHKEYEIID